MAVERSIAYNKIIRCIDSCVTYTQLDNTMRMIDRYNEIYLETYSTWMLKTYFEEHREEL